MEKPEKAAVMVIDRSFMLQKKEEIASVAEGLERKKKSGEIPLDQLAIARAINKAKSELLDDILAHEIDPD